MRGFLFADLRNYTGYLEARGDHAGAALLERYGTLVRNAVASGQGAEIKTEGDSFYVVFDSASAAVQAGLAIVAAAATADPTDPIRVGVGVHAGEAVETAGGFVGSVVNIAARLCAEAKAGELVVSDTVRALTRTYLDVAFEPLGSRRLKGVEEPIVCYRVVARARGAGAGVAPRPTARRGSPRVLAALLGVAAIVVAGAIVLSRGGGTAAPTPGPSASPAAFAHDSPAATTPTTSSLPSASANSGTFPSTVESAIRDALPSTLAPRCVRGGTADDARLAGFLGFNRVSAFGDVIVVNVNPSESLGGLTCYPAGGATRLYVMEPVNGSGGSAAGDEFLGYLEGKYQLPYGSCATTALAHETWANSTGSGDLACMNPYDGRPWIYFSFGKGTYLAFATRDDSDYAALYAWWEQLKTLLP